MWRFVVLLLACTNPRPESVEAEHRPDLIAPGVTHGAPITAIAVTEQGDAALTLDDRGGLRLWPSLDGTRPPVPVHAAGVVELALAHVGDRLLAAFLDTAGNVLLLELGLDGSVRNRAQIPGDAPCEHLIAIPAGVLVVRADQSIERYDASARLRGRIMAEPREHITAIAARRGGAIALVSPTSVAREIAIDSSGLRWGTSIPLSAHVGTGTVALSPDHRRIAVIDREASDVQVLDVATYAAVGASVHVTTLEAAFGFTDNDHLAVLTPSIQWWQAPAVHDVDTASKIEHISGGAVGDGVAVGGTGASLALGTATTIHYLGWSTPAMGEALVAAGSHVMLTNHSSAIMLDGRLTFSGARDAYGQTWLWIGPRHVIQSRPEGTVLVDLDDPDHGVVLSRTTTNMLYYEPALHLLALYVPPSRIERYVLDLDHTTATPLVPLETPTLVVYGGQHVDLLDPQRADGTIAIARWSGYRKSQADITHLAIFRTPDVKPSRELIVAEVLAIDPTGAMYVRDTANGPIIVRRIGKPDLTLAGVVATTLVPSHDATMFATLRDPTSVRDRATELAVFDSTGHERWRRALWSPWRVVFSSDDRDLVVQVAGGLISFDAKTGAQRAVACSFDFGLHDQSPGEHTLFATPICEARP